MLCRSFPSFAEKIQKIVEEGISVKVFISWSGNKSKAVAELLGVWLQCVLQAINPWISTQNIDKGSVWFNEIHDQLNDICTGIICLTQQNINSPWILFESGALAKGLTSSRVCTLLIDLKPTDIKEPLAQFNHTIPDKEGMQGLIKTLNKCLGDKAIKEEILSKIFETYWPEFQRDFSKINENTEENDYIDEKHSSYEILNEILSTTRSLDKKVEDLEKNSKHYMYDKSVKKIVDDVLDIWLDLERNKPRKEIFNKYSHINDIVLQVSSIWETVYKG